MDVTLEYIKMCDCPEIQGQLTEKGYRIGDWHVDREALPDGWRSINVANDCPEYGLPMIMPTKVWLPTQDQLQNMLVTFVKDSRPYPLIKALHDWIEQGHGILGDTLEKIWLSYVMFIRYNKLWDGTNWMWQITI